MQFVLCLLLVAACSIPSKLASGDAGPNGGGGDDGGGAGAIDAMVDADPAAPTITLTATPPALGNVPSVTFTYSVTPITATVECRIDANTYEACPPPSAMFTAIADGAHTFDIRAIENGHTANAPTYAFTIDTVPPNVVITMPPPDPTNITSGTIAFSAGDAVTVTCAFDGATAQACTSPAAYGPLADGAHSFALSGTDAAGNTKTTAATWTVQTVPPTLSLINKPNANDNRSSFTFTFTTNGATSVTCAVDGGTAVACATSFATGTLADGSHSFVLAGKDTAGNSASVTYPWTIDTVPPVLSTITGGTSPNKSRTTSFGFTVTGGTTSCAVNVAPPGSPCTSPYQATVASDGNQTIVVTAADLAGNTATQSYSWFVDSIPPTVSTPVIKVTSCDPDMWTATYSISDANLVSFSCGYAGFTYDCSQTSYTSNFIGSPETFSVTATDIAGNVTTKSATVKDTCDLP